MSAQKPRFGIAMCNFTAYPKMPDPEALLDYAVRAEELGYESLWVWDHILLGVDPHFPILESLTLLSATAARTSRIKLGTGILVLTMRNPVVLAKQLSTLDQISNGRFILGAAGGWYKREFDAVGVDFKGRGKVMDQNLEILKRLWEEDMVSGDYPPHELRNAVMSPKPVQRPRPPILIGGYVDAALRRAATKGDGWLTYCYTAESFARAWGKVQRFADAAGRDPDTLNATNQLPIVVGDRDKVEAPMREWLDKEWDFAGWSESTPESAVIGPVDEVVEQLQAHIDAGVHRLVFMPYRYQAEQVEILAKEVVPRLQGAA
ncbi:MAG: TIGR03619 family F420-dependent LLM class oxidoreductase [Gammaproteobacteria bacterium]|nr:TIGR03619 family F420-dependent LLM class oxidoreductase [Gammaproteobacteria bacterium]NIR85589.1 TIGR03619 family F420-dependent LLM class oxidoreductase [Gammaproteobacteria bacterium]NIR90030.1 TIGR03619 family F420-dependent LLM class oxidoreductase [Gammaproteobacteria bacterium]NIU06718.1 TIGR03619 family F420-dependent LLM class oxidoreductase [Gammaproteobacteria bacterium]NIV53649.1 TIGR03619 family F420-dependent LLM class oxidoreductase [Gammaproteobacteria bacterium]